MTMEKYDVLKEELMHVRESLSRAMGTLFTLYGVLVPALGALLAIYGKDSFKSNDQNVVGFVAVAFFSVGSAFANVLWIETQKYIRYLYVELLPRMYRYAGMELDINFMQFVASNNNEWEKFPHRAFICMSYIAIAVVGFGFMLSAAIDGRTRAIVLIVFGGAMFITVLATTVVASKMFTKLLGDLSDQSKKNEHK